MPSSMAAPMHVNTSIPIAIFGKDLEIAKAVSKKLMPDYETVHIATDLASALATLPPLFKPRATGPTYNKGLYQPRPTLETARVPQVVLFGGKVTDAEYKEISHAVGGAAACASRLVTFVTIGKLDVLAAGAIGPNADVIARVFRKKMAPGLGKRLQQGGGGVGGENGAAGNDGDDNSTKGAANGNGDGWEKQKMQ